MCNLTPLLKGIPQMTQIICIRGHFLSWTKDKANKQTTNTRDWGSYSKEWFNDELCKVDWNIDSAG